MIQHIRNFWLAIVGAGLFAISGSIFNVRRIQGDNSQWYLGDIPERQSPCVTDDKKRQEGEEPNNLSTQPCVTIVYKVGTLQSDCEVKRFLALAKGVPPEKYNVVLLHDPDLPFDSRILRVLQDNLPHVELSQVSLNTPEMMRKRTQHDPFYMWASNRSSCHYWFVEDDLVFTGDWGHFFGTVDRRVGNEVDYVSDAVTINSTNWYPGEICNVMGHSCTIDNGTRFVQGHHSIFRISQRMVDHIADLISQNQLKSMDEAYLPAACRMYPGCKHRQLFGEGPHWERQFFGYNQMGRHCVWFPENRNKSVYTLAGLARLRSTKRVLCKKDETWKALNSTDLLLQQPPRNRIFHPVRCSADPMIGDVSLGYAAESIFSGYSKILDLFTPPDLFPP